MYLSVYLVYYMYLSVFVAKVSRVWKLPSLGQTFENQILYFVFLIYVKMYLFLCAVKIN